MINEQKLRVFLALADTLNFTETANRLFITQQAVSKHISQLECDLGCRLFIRSTHHVTLTSAGERCRRFFAEELERFGAFMESERAMQQKMSKAIRIGYNNLLDLGNTIRDADLRFHDSYPDIEHIPERQAPDLLLSKLRHDELDLVVILRRFILDCRGFVLTPLTSIPMVILMNRNHPLAKEPFDGSRLSAYPLLINAFHGETVPETMRRARKEMAAFSLNNKRIVVMPNRDSVYTALETGNGIAIACSNSQHPADVTAVATQEIDTLVCVRMADNHRKLVARYMLLLQEIFRQGDGQPRIFANT